MLAPRFCGLTNCNDLLKIYQLQQSTTNEGFDPGMCRSDPISMIGRLADVS